MESAREQFRFAETNRLIEENIGDVGALLEVGCGEGHQSLELQKVCGHLYGLDISRRAVKRAEERCKAASFYVGDVFQCPLFDIKAEFDLVVACEVLYYVKDTRAAISRLASLGRSCLVTVIEQESPNLKKHLNAMPNVQHGYVTYGPVRWEAFWWSRQGGPKKAWA